MKMKIVNWVIITICCIFTVEILLRSKLFSTIRDMNTVYKKTIRVINNKKISDYWKEKVLPAYARLIFRISLTLMLTLILIFSPFIAIGCLAVPLNLNIQTILLSSTGLIGTTFFTIIYGLLRGRYVKK